MTFMIFGVLFVALGLFLFYQGAHDYGAPDREAIIKKYKEAGAMFDEASKVYNEAIRKYPRTPR